MRNGVFVMSSEGTACPLVAGDISYRSKAQCKRNEIPRLHCASLRVARNDRMRHRDVFVVRISNRTRTRVANTNALIDGANFADANAFPYAIADAQRSHQFCSATD